MLFIHNQDSAYLTMSLPVRSVCIATTIVHVDRKLSKLSLDDQEGIELSEFFVCDQEHSKPSAFCVCEQEHTEPSALCM